MSERDLAPEEVQRFFDRIIKLLTSSVVKSATEQPTPGPWRVGRHGGCVVSDTPVHDVSGTDSVEYYGGHLICESVARRNAKLIAAAPELLNALINCLQCIELEERIHGMPSSVGNEAREAIKKATA